MPLLLILAYVTLALKILYNMCNRARALNIRVVDKPPSKGS